jgi:hypothetical protein
MAQLSANIAMKNGLEPLERSRPPGASWGVSADPARPSLIPRGGVNFVDSKI